MSNALQEALAEIQQPRSEYQLQHFVVNQHDTEPQRYRQCLTEIQAISYTLRTVKLELQKSEIQIERLRATRDSVDELDAQIKEVGMAQRVADGLDFNQALTVALRLGVVLVYNKVLKLVLTARLLNFCQRFL